MGNEYVLDDLKLHPRVCSECWRLRHSEAPVPDRVNRLKVRTVWAKAVQPEWIRERDTTGVDAPPGDTVSDRTPRTVCDCGRFSTFGSSYRDDHEPLDMAVFVDYTGNLSDTLFALSGELAERGLPEWANRYAHDRDVLYSTARYLKSQPENQFKDDLIFATSVEIACRRKDEYDGTK